MILNLVDTFYTEGAMYQVDFHRMGNLIPQHYRLGGLALAATFCQTSLPAALVLFISVVFQGCWFMNMGFMLWVPKLVPKGCVVSFIEGSIDNVLGSSVTCRSSESEFRARALANLQFSWILSGILIFIACTCLKFAGKCIQRDLSIESMSNSIVAEEQMSE